MYPYVMADPEKLISEEPFKIGTHSRGEGIVEFRYDDVFEPQLEREPQRLLIAPGGRHVDLLMRLSREMPPPYSILYILVAPRSGARAGRYMLGGQSDSTLNELLETNREYLEGDARHHIWIGSESDGSLLVYDQHNVIYAYGQIDQFSAILRACGMHAGRVQFPYPHTHHFRSTLDHFEADLLRRYPWQWNLLEEEDMAD
jgi:hypothetical protein